MRFSHLRSKPSLQLLVLALIATFAGGASTDSTIRAADLSVRELVDAGKAAIRKIDSIEGSFSSFSEGLAGNGYLKGPNGWGEFTKFKWGYEQQSGREYLVGGWWGDDPKRKESPEFHAGEFRFDGKVLRTRNNSGSKTGTIREVGSTFVDWSSPSLLWGRFVTPTRNVYDLLEGATLVEIPNTPPALKVLRRDVEGSSTTVTMWLDLEHGFLSKRIEVSRSDERVVMRRIEVLEFSQTPGGVWIPTRGTDTKYFVRNDFKLPGSITMADLKKMSTEEVKKVIARSEFTTEKLGRGTNLYVLSTDNLRVNESIPDDQFTLVFAKGSGVWDDTKKLGYAIGNPEDDPELRNPAFRSRLLIAIPVVVVLLALGIVFVYRYSRARG